LIKPVEINLNLRSASLYTRISAKVVKALPAKYLPIINSAADVVGRIMTSRPIGYGMRILFDRNYDLGAARRLASGADLAKRTFPEVSLASSIGWSIPQPIIFIPPTQRQYDWQTSLAEAKKELNAKKRLMSENIRQTLPSPSEAAKSTNWQAKWARDSAQVEMNQFGQNVRKMLEELIRKDNARSEQTAHERLSMAIELPDGTLIPIFTAYSSEEKFSCGLPANYKELEEKALLKVDWSISKLASMQNGKLTIYHFHTHPEVEGMYIERELDGRYITALSQDDYAMSESNHLFNLIKRIRLNGFEGQIEVVMGAVPALAGEKIGAEIKVATYTQKYAQLSSMIQQSEYRKSG
jgi:hypothetical protein